MYLIWKNEDASISFNRNNWYMKGLIQANKYTYDICKEYGKEEYFSFLGGHLIYRLNQFIVSDLSFPEKKDVLKSSSFLFKKCIEYGSTYPKSLKNIIDLITNEEYDAAILLANELNDLVKYQNLITHLN